jgi:hypothetical protein
MDMDTFFALAAGELDLREAKKQGLARVEGDTGAMNRCFRVFSISPRVAA